MNGWRSLAAVAAALQGAAVSGQPVAAGAPPVPPVVDGSGAASAAAQAAASPAATVVPDPVAAAPRAILRRDTPVELMALREVSTASVQPGTRFKLQVNKAIVVDGRTLVPVGALAFGEVVSAIDAGGLGKSGRMTARLLYIEVGDGQIPIDGEMSAKGTGAGSAGVAILFAGITGFFHRGNNAKIKAGELLAGFVRDDVMLDVSGTVPRVVAAAPPAGASRP